MDPLRINFIAMKEYSKKLDSISSNIANVSSPGYKKSSVVFKFENDSILGTNYTDISNGELIKTFSDMDIAIDGNGFFVLTDGNEIFYSRNGSLKINENGELVNVNNLKFLSDKGNIKVDPQKKIKIDKDGNIIQEDKIIAKLLVKNFSDKVKILPVGNSLYRIEGEEKDKEYKILQGYQEASNVNIIDEMSSMIKLMRDFERNEKIIKENNQITSRMISVFSKF